MEEIGDLFHQAVEEAPVAQDLVAALQEVLTMGLLLEQQREQLESDLKATTTALTKLKEQTIPGLMDQLGMSKITKDNFEIKIDSFVRGSLPKEEPQRTRAINWLKQHGQAGLIKTDVSMHFGRDEQARAERIAKDLRAQGFEVFEETGVHPQTLMAFGREALKNGDEFEPEILGLYVGRSAKIKRLADK